MMTNHQQNKNVLADTFLRYIFPALEFLNFLDLKVEFYGNSFLSKLKCATEYKDSFIRNRL